MVNKKNEFSIHDSDVVVTYFHLKKSYLSRIPYNPFQLPHFVCVCVEIRIEFLNKTSQLFLFYKWVCYYG